MAGVSAPVRPDVQGREGPTGAQVLRRAVAGQWRCVVPAAALAVSHQAGEAMVPVIIGLVIDEAVSTGSVSALLQWIAVLAVAFAVLSYSYRYGYRLAERAAQLAAHGLRIDLTRRVLDPRGGAESGRLPGALVSIATGDARRVGAVALALPQAIAAVAAVAVCAVALLRISVPLGLLVLLGTPPLLGLAHLLGRPLERRSDEEQDRAAHASGVAADLVTGLRVLKGIGAEPAAVGRYRRISQDSLAATIRAARARSWHDGILMAVTGVFIAVVALVGGRLAMSGEIDVGGLVSAVGLALFLLGPLSMFAWANAALAQGRASAERIASVLAATPAVPGGDEQLGGEAAGRVRVRDLTHGTLRGLDLDVGAGELVAVAADHPGVAADLLACLGRHTDPEFGSIELDGVALARLDPAVVRGAILVAAHDAVLFEGTLTGNITLGSADGARALVASAADEVARALPCGGDTLITERGQSLSGGQRQRVALARALAADPPVLVLHDPTTAVDAVTEARIAAGIRELRRGRTTIIVTSSPALLTVADRVLFLAEGTLTAHGSHTDLVRENDAYRVLVLA